MVYAVGTRLKFQQVIFHSQGKYSVRLISTKIR